MGDWRKETDELVGKKTSARTSTYALAGACLALWSQYVGCSLLRLGTK